MNRISLKRLDPEESRPDFSCGDCDLDEFYQIDSIEGGKQLLSVTYVLISDSRAVAFFSVSNDSIKKEDVPRSVFERIVKIIPFGKRYSSMPAAKIGRLATTKDLQRTGVGTMVLDFLKAWFTQGNKTGCRFLLVDAYNERGIPDFYIKNRFSYLTEEDKADKTRIMYFDLIQFRQ